MSSPVLTNPRGPAYRKPQADVYTALLALAALALILAMLCLYFEMQRFEFDMKPPPVMGMFVLGPTTACSAQPAWPGASPPGSFFSQRGAVC
jgi:hypothetical protein